jgi:hypothetical protein
MFFFSFGQDLSNTTQPPANGRKARRKSRRARTFQPAVTALESRVTPAGNVTTPGVIAGTLTLTGDLAGNDVTITEVGNKIVVTPTGGTTLNGGAGAASFSAVTNLNINFSQGGNDSVKFDITSHNISLPGFLSVTFGTGSSTTTTAGPGGDTHTLSVGSNLAIAYGNGTEHTTLDNFSVGGNMTITHKNGDASVTLGSLAIGTVFNNVTGNLTVNNANAAGTVLYSGLDDNALLETNVGGSVSVNMGNGNATTGHAGFTSFGSTSGSQLTVGVNMNITSASNELDGPNVFGKAGLEVVDTNVNGNVTLQATGTSSTIYFGEGTSGLASNVGGSLSATTLGAFDDVKVFDTNVGTNLTVRVQGFSSDITLTDVNVAGNTNLTALSDKSDITIDGADSVTGSNFQGAFNLTTGNGSATLDINSDGGGGATFFGSPVNIKFGSGDDSMNLATTGLVTFSGGTINGDGGTNIDTVVAANLAGILPTITNFI